jgi:hypothetical protein
MRFGLTTLAGVILPALVLTFASGCSDNITSDTKLPSQKGSEIYTTDPINVADVGTLHNDGLEHMLATFPSTGPYADSTTKATALLGNICGYFKSTRGWDSAEMHTTYLRDSIAAMMIGRYYTTPDSWWNRVRSDNFLTSHVSQTELYFMDNAHAIFTADYSGMTGPQACDAITAGINALISEYNSTTWSGPTGGEMAGGLLYLTKGSAAYWKLKGMASTTDPHAGGEIHAQIVEADCLGYITGWASALFDDANSSRGVRVEGQWRRMGQGVIWGLGTSGLGWLATGK